MNTAKTFTFLILTVIFHNNILAQNDFAPIGAKWTYEAPWCPLWDHCWYYTLEATKDTTIANQNARLLKYTKYTVDGIEPIPEADLIMYGDEDKVYYYLDDHFELLYDFSAQVGDTVSVKLGHPLNLNFYSAGGTPQTDSCAIVPYQIDSTSTMTINNELLRVQYVSYVTNDVCWSFRNPIVEKMGTLGCCGIFGNECNLVLAGVHGELRCYEDENFAFNQSDVDCDYIFIPSNANKEIVELNASYFYPNPTMANIHISCPILNKEEVEVNIFDVSGTLIYSNIQYLLPDQEIDISINDTGVFYVRITSKDKIYTGEFVKM